MALSLTSKVKLLTGNLIPVIGLGTYSLKGEVCQQSVKSALQVGYRHIDTGSIFKNQTQIKNAWIKAGLQIKDIYISTKVGAAQQGYKQSMETCERILKSFESEYLDLVLIHWPGSSKCSISSQKNKDFRFDTWKGLLELKSKGKIKDIGVSNFMIKHLQHLQTCSGQRPAVNQFEVHPLLWQKQLIEFCQLKNIAIEAYSPLGKGDFRILANQTLKKIAQKYSKTISQISLRWSLQHNFIVIPGSKNPVHIKENAEIFDFELSKQEMQIINELSQSNMVRINWDGNKVIY